MFVGCVIVVRAPAQVDRPYIGQKVKMHACMPIWAAVPCQDARMYHGGPSPMLRSSTPPYGMATTAASWPSAHHADHIRAPGHVHVDT